MTTKSKHRKPAYKPSLDVQQTDTLLGLVNKCLEKAHDYGSDFGINADEFLLLGKFLTEIENIKNEKYIVNSVGVVV